MVDEARHTNMEQILAAFLLLSVYFAQVANGVSDELVSPGRPCTQSSSHDNTSCTLAVDGNLATSHPQCFHSAGGDGAPWLQLDLGRQRCLTRAQIINRQDCCPDKLRYFKVFVKNDSTGSGTDETMCYKHPTFAKPNEVINFSCTKCGRYIRVLNGIGPLQLCELKVYASARDTDKCHFPFHYAGVNYTTCANGRVRPWCSLTANFDGKWRYCTEVEAASSAKGCPVGFPLKYQSTCIAAVGEKMDYEHSREKCEELGGHLLTVTSAGMQDFAYKTAKSLSAGDIWRLNGYRYDAGFRSVHNNRLFYTNWSPGEPNNYKLQDERCVALYSAEKFASATGKWNDENCGIERSFFCGTTGCPVRYALKHDHTCIAMIEEAMAYNESINECKRIGGNLLIVESSEMESVIYAAVDSYMEENFKIYAKVHGYTEEKFKIWRIAGYRHGDTFKDHKGNQLVYSNWAPGEPNNYKGHGEECTAIHKGLGGKWNDEICTLKRPFFCGMNPTEKNKCAFPFYYNGAKYSTCKRSYGKYWCSLTTHYEGKWRYCSGSEADSAVNKCPLGYTHRHGDTCFEFVHKKMVYDQSDRYCKAHGGQLLVVTSYGMSDHLAHKIDLHSSDAERLWRIGGVRKGKIFVNPNGTELSYSNWAVGEPNNAENKENCILISERKGTMLPKWNDEDCNRQRKFICGINYPSRCQFPFKYKGVTYTTCAHSKSGYWCSLTKNYSGKYRFCTPRERKAASKGCPPKYGHSYADTCIAIVRDLQTYADSKAYCRQMGGNLLTVSSVGMSKYLFQEITVFGGEHNNIWRVDGYRVRGDIFQDSNHNNLSYTNWGKGEPNNAFGNEKCVSIHKGMNPGKANDNWNDESCSSLRHFSCGIKKMRCAVPFKYRNHSYKSCTTVDNDGKPWCSLTNKYSGLWRECDEEESGVA